LLQTKLLFFATLKFASNQVTVYCHVEIASNEFVMLKSDSHEEITFK